MLKKEGSSKSTISPIQKECKKLLKRKSEQENLKGDNLGLEIKMKDDYQSNKGKFKPGGAPKINEKSKDIGKQKNHKFSGGHNKKFQGKR